MKSSQTETTDGHGERGQNSPGLWPVPLGTELFIMAVKRPIIASGILAACPAGLLSIHPSFDFAPLWIAFTIVLYIYFTRPY